MKLNLISIFFVLLFSFELNAQVNLLNAQDPADIGKRDMKQIKQDEDKKLEYGYVDERDIMFSKVIWEVIDLDQRVNFPYLYPIDTSVVGKERRPLIHFLLKGMKEGKITLIYDDGKFNDKISYDDFMNNETKFQGLKYKEINRKGTSYIDIAGGRNVVLRTNEVSIAPEYDSIPDLDEFLGVLEYESEFDDSKKDEIKKFEETRDNALMKWLEDNFGEKYVTTYDFTYDMIDHYKIKGIWYFDKRIAELKYRPLAIAPVARQVSNKKDDSGASPEDRSDPVDMFWIYYPDARNVLKDSYVFSDRNSVVRKSFDELINARRFHTMIYLEENMYEDREIGEYITDNAFQRLLESERIKEKIRNFEHDMWSW
jgi:gliding motility associated protien GldN